MEWFDIKFDPINLPLIGSDPSLIPDADCENCKYWHLRNDEAYPNQHCYMFEDSPGDKCGQFKLWYK